MRKKRLRIGRRRKGVIPRGPKLPPPPKKFIYLKNIAYGPDGFTCKCRSRQFERWKRKYSNKRNMSIYKCLGCGEDYIFIPTFMRAITI